MSDLTRSSRWEAPLALEEAFPQASMSGGAFGAARLDFRQYYLTLLRRKWLVVAAMVTMVAASAFQVYTTTPQYTAVARLQIDPDTANVLPYEDPFQSPFYVLAAEAYVRTQAEILRSRALAKRIVVALNLAEDPIFNAPTRAGFFSETAASVMDTIRALLASASSSSQQNPAPPSQDEREEGLADAFRGAVGVNPIRGTRLLELSFTSHDPLFAARVLNELTKQYLELTFERKVRSTNVAGEFLVDRLAELKAKVEESERRMLEYARANDIVNFDESNQDLVVRKLVALTSELTAAEARAIAESTRFESVKGVGPDEIPQVHKSPKMLQLEATLSELRQEIARLSVTFGPDWPELKQKQQEIEIVQQQLWDAGLNALSRIREDYHNAVALREKLRAAVDEQKVRANELFAASIQYNILKGEVETNKKLHESLLQRSKQAEISAGLRSSNIQVIDDARPPRFASSPNKRRAIMFGLFLGLALGVGLAFLMEYVDSSVKTPEDLMEFTGLPTLSVIPSMDHMSTMSLRLRQANGDSEDNALALRSLPSSGSHMWEAYRALRTSLLLSHSGGPPRTILVTSALPGEGKTTTAVHTAMVLAQAGKRTVLIDLDLRKPAVARMMGMDGSRGITNYLAGNSRLAAQLQPSGLSNLFVLSSGPNPPNPAELIGSPRMQSSLSLLKDYVEFVVIDSPPILSVSDALILANLVDGVVLVVQGGKTPREAVRKAGDRLVSVGGHILGALINNVDVRKSEYSYYYRYYYYYDDYYPGSAPQTQGAAES